MKYETRKPQGKTIQGKAKRLLISQMLELRTGFDNSISYTISNPLCNKKTEFEHLSRFLRSSIVHLPTAHFKELHNLNLELHFCVELHTKKSPVLFHIFVHVVLRFLSLSLLSLFSLSFQA